MTSDPQQIAPWNLPPPRRHRDPGSVTLAVVLGVVAVLATYAVYRLRGEAAEACDMLERMGGFVLMVASFLLLCVNLVLATALWAVFRTQGGLGVVAAAGVAVVLFAITAVVYLALT